MCLTGCALSACGVFSPASPSSPSAVTFEFDGTFQRSCTVNADHSCNAAPFGSGVAPGTPVTGHLRFDPNTRGVAILNTDQSRLISYAGVAVDFTVGTSVVSGNDSSIGALEVDSYGDGTGDQFGVTIVRGFRSGQVAGLGIDCFLIVLPIVPSRFPDASLPRAPSIFDLTLQYAGAPLARVDICHYASPDLWPLALEGPGATRLEGQISTVRLLR